MRTTLVWKSGIDGDFSQFELWSPLKKGEEGKV